MRLKHTADDLERSGMKGIIERAQADSDARIFKAVAHLEPLGMDAAELTRVVDEHVKRKSGL